MFCREWLAQLERHHGDFEAAGLRLAAVGLGEPKHARHYCPQLAPSLTCLVGKGVEAHAAYGVQRGTWQQLVGPAVIAAGLRATASGAWQGAATGDGRMLSATFVVDEQGVIRFAFYGEHPGDHPDLDRVLRGLRCEARAAGLAEAGPGKRGA
jgi:hypothetical protein